ncbi:oxidoreductase [Streptomyces gamaensis]|uniref:Oxidoreductase n=1 Tax=Streptomyces gamaensis TaxID=1763542 RepID=A0ABW0Z7Q9_9ACTN
MTHRVALVTGASSGIGEAAARRLQELGLTVYAAARRTARMAHLAERGVRPLAMDVTDEQSRQQGIARIIAECGRVDVLVNNAGYGCLGAVEDVPLDEARHQFEVNVFGAARLIQLVLPHMRERHSGRIVNVSSIGGRIHTPLGAWYHATKYALEGLSDVLRLEVAPFGIDVVVIQPGGIRTEFAALAAEHLREVSGDGVYGRRARAVAEALSTGRGTRHLSSPVVVADAIGKAATAPRPRTRYAVGFGARPLLALRRALPDRGFDAVVRRAVA